MAVKKKREKNKTFYDKIDYPERFKNESGMKFLYIFFAGLRIILTFIPQTGYIHPDEFFQAPEIVFGDLLKIKSLKTWEFFDHPLRSITFPYLMIGIPAVFLRLFTRDNKMFPYLLLVLPRIIMCAFSFIQDICFYKIFKLIGKNPYKPLLIFTSCYVTLVYLTRTFSNTLEGVYLSVLMYIILSKSILNQSKVKTYTMYDENLSAVSIAILCASGFFLRPTFMFFAFVPMIMWLISLSYNLQCQISKIFVFILSFLTLSLFFVFVDTIYYEGECNILLKFSYDEFSNLILTPLNFILYNLNSKNLSHHGYHPKYFHFLVNMPLMFTILGLYAMWKTSKIIFFLFKNRILICTKVDLFFLLSFIVPMLFLSLVPHQEPRFLIPILLPLICFCGESLYDRSMKNKLLLFVWIVLNFIGVLVFGFIHQGGLIPCLSYFHTHVIKNPNVTYNLVFYHTYMPPQHLLAVPKAQKYLNIHDLSGSNDEILLESLHTIFNYSRRLDHIYVISPGTKSVSLINLNVMLQSNYKFVPVASFFPHLSTESAPSLHNLWLLLQNFVSLDQKLDNFKIIFSLHVYEIMKLVD